MLDPKILKPGEEQYEQFSYRGNTYFQYDFRDYDNELFSCIGKNLSDCLKKLEKWKKKKYIFNKKPTSQDLLLSYCSDPEDFPGNLKG